MTVSQRTDLTMPLPDEAVQVAVRAVEEVIGAAGLRTVARQCGLEELLDEQGRVRPGVTVCFQDVGRLTQGLLEVYGVRGAAATLRRAGRVQFQQWLAAYPTALGVAAAALKALPPGRRVQTVLQAVATAAQRLVGVKAEVQSQADGLHFIAHQCPYCAGVQADHPFCQVAVGALEEVTRWATDRAHRVREVRCMAQGDLVCEFVIEPLE